MKIEEFLKNIENGDYGVLKKPVFNEREVLSEIESNTPQFINENRSVKWNKQKREEKIKEEYEKRYVEYAIKRDEWFNKDKEATVKYQSDKINMLKEELNLNEEQVIHLFKVLFEADIYHYSITVKNLNNIKKILLNMKKFFELAN